METQGKGAFDLDGASEPYNRGARHASDHSSEAAADEPYRRGRVEVLHVKLVHLELVQRIQLF